MESECCGHTRQCHGLMAIVVGAVLFVTAMNWPQNIWQVIGVFLILKGVMKLAMPKCPCQNKMDKKSKK